MNRLSEGVIELNDVEVFNSCSYSCYMNIADALNKLAAYEDTGLEPEEVEQYKIFEDGLVLKYGCTLQQTLNLLELYKQGLLIKLPPISNGDTLYWIWGDKIMPVKCRGIDRGVVYKMATKEDRTFNKFDGTPFVYEKGNIRFFYADDFGKTVFLTREEAEKALKEREEK